MPKKSTPPALDPTADAKGGSEQTFTLKDLERVAELAMEIISIEEAMGALQVQMQLQSDRLNLIQLEILPSLMDSIGLSDFRLKSGERVLVKPLIRASLPSQGAIEKERDADKKAEALDRYERGLTYLKAHGAAALIKQTLEAVLGKGEEPLAKKAVKALKDLGVQAAITRGVHPATLTSWVKERLAGGKEVDMDLFRVFNGHKAEIEGNKPRSGQQPSSPAKSAGKASRSLF